MEFGLNGVNNGSAGRHTDLGVLASRSKLGCKSKSDVGRYVCRQRLAGRWKDPETAASAIYLSGPTTTTTMANMLCFAASSIREEMFVYFCVDAMDELKVQRCLSMALDYLTLRSLTANIILHISFVCCF